MQFLSPFGESRVSLKVLFSGRKLVHGRHPEKHNRHTSLIGFNIILRALKEFITSFSMHENCTFISQGDVVFHNLKKFFLSYKKFFPFEIAKLFEV